MSLTDDLYRDVILDHFREPRNHGTLDQPDLQAQGANPFCGDELTLTVRFREETIDQIQAVCKGCSISQASTSMMTESVQGKTISETEEIIRQFKRVMLENAPADFSDDLEDLEALEGVKKYPVRIKCAILSWNTLLESLGAYRKGEHQTQHTEGEEGDRPELAQQAAETAPKESDEPAPSSAATGGKEEIPELQEQVRKALTKVIDPELNMNVVDLGLIYDIEVSESKRVRVAYTLTSPGCPLAPIIKGQIQGAVTQLSWVQGIQSDLVWKPPWDPKTMASEEVKGELGIW